MHPVHHIPSNTPYRPSADAWASSGGSVVGAEELHRAVPVPRKMRQRRRRARPIRAEAGASATNQGRLCILPGNWDTTGGTVLPRAGGDNTLFTGESRPSDLYRGIWHWQGF